jgi:uncharacterized protein YeaO (DUF488 family)
MSVKIKRIYESFDKSDGYRILVDRLWPRGIKKEKAHIDEWMKEAGPSTDLRKWFNHEPEKWMQFLTKYRAELKGSTTFNKLISLIAKYRVITLLFSAKDERYNQAAALLQFLDERHKSGAS